jgi:transposase-like protein
VDWLKIKAEYISGNISYRKLAEKHGVSFNTLKRRAVEEEWYKLRQQKEEKTTTKIINSASDKDAKKANKIIDVADKLLDKISAMVDKAGEYNTQNIKNLTSALKDLKEIKGYKSDVDLREQEARIANLERQAQAVEESKDITVTIVGDLNEYSK